jgi:hypothetical protein
MSAAPAAANKVLLKKSSVVSKVPLTTDLAYGELALNYADGLLYYKSANNVIQYFSDSNTSVTLTGTQTLTNKTLTSPTINNAILTGTLTAGGGVGTSGQVLSSTGTGVQWVDQTGGAGGSGNSFTTIAVSGQSSVLADSSTDTLTLVAGGVLSITTNATTDTITIGTAASFFPFTKYDGNASNIPLYTEMTTLQNSLDTVFLPFIKSDGSSVTTLKLTV